MEELIKVNEEVRITSMELVELINDFRKLEGRKTKLEHSDFMKKIRKELNTLKSLGLDNGGNISLVDYTDSKGEKRPCYSLNKDGMLQMLNSESTLVRFKTIEHINVLENKIKQIHSLTTPSNIGDLLEKIDEKTNRLDAYYKPTHRRKLEINKYIKQCLGTLATKENCDRVKDILLTQLGYEIYDEVPIDILHSKETMAKIFNICYMIAVNNNEVQIKLDIQEEN